jgi:hypothetical protein
VFKHSPVDEFQILTVLSALPLASSPAFDHATVLTKSLQFSQMSGNTYVMVVYASPPLSGGGVEPTHAKLATFRNMQAPVALNWAIWIGFVIVVMVASALFVVRAAPTRPN